MVTLLVLAWLVPLIPIGNLLGHALRRRCSASEQRVPLPLPSQRSGHQ